MKNLSALTFAIRAMILLVLGIAFLGVRDAHAASGAYDTDGDGLIEVSSLEQLDAIRYDPDGDGKSDEANPDAEVAYAAAFPDDDLGAFCAGGCSGYELARDLDFQDADSYAANEVRVEWTEGFGWPPIGAENAPFAAIFEGNGHTIANLYIYIEMSYGSDYPINVGLFSAVASSGLISNVGLTDIDVAASALEGVGGLVGFNEGAIDNSYATGSISGIRCVGGLVGFNEGAIDNSYATGSASGAESVGGLVGRNFSEIDNSYATGSASGEEVIGGLVGFNHEGAIDNSYATGSASGAKSVGGLVGRNFSEIDNSYATGSASGEAIVGGLVGGSYEGEITSSYATGKASGEYRVGGLVGVNFGEITSSYATGRAWGRNDVGGLAGGNFSEIDSSYATGSVSGEDEVGGLVGYNDGDGYLDDYGGAIGNSYSTGSVAGTEYVGGLVGSNYEGEIDNSYATGSVSGTEYVGGLVGRNYEGEIVSSYWDTQTSGQRRGVGDGDSAEVEGKTTAELQTPTDSSGIYSAWGETWDFGNSTQYPTLKADFGGDGNETSQEFGSQIEQEDSGACSSARAISPAAAAGNILMMLAPLAMIGGIRFVGSRRRADGGEG